MTVAEMVRITDANILLGAEHQDRQFSSAFCSDLMSDMILDSKQITFVEDQKDQENHNYPDLTDFRESDLYQWLNNEMFNTLFQNDAMGQAVTETDQGVL